MKQILRYFLILLVGVLTTAQAAPLILPSAPKIAAKGYVLQDFHSGRVLAELNADERMEPASLTKLMTAYVAFHELRDGNISLDDKVRVSKKAWHAPGSRMFIEVNTEVPVRHLFQGMIVQSGNDASIALAEHIAGSEDAFASLMNAYAQKLGMTGSHFANATGLPNPEHYSTPRDMARLAAALIREFPEYYSWYSEKKFTYNNITQYNRNKLLWRDKSVDGLKTGHTKSAGYCLVSSAKREQMRLISVVMGTASENARAQESQTLLNYGFRFFETHRLYGPNEPLKTMRIWKGDTDSLQVGLAKPLYVTVPRGQYNSLKASMTVERTIEAPVNKGQAVGMVELRLGDKTVAKRPLIALADVSEGSLWHRLVDRVMLMVK